MEGSTMDLSELLERAMQAHCHASDALLRSTRPVDLGRTFRDSVGIRVRSIEELDWALNNPNELPVVTAEPPAWFEELPEDEQAAIQSWSIGGGNLLTRGEDGRADFNTRAPMRICAALRDGMAVTVGRLVDEIGTAAVSFRVGPVETFPKEFQPIDEGSEGTPSDAAEAYGDGDDQGTAEEFRKELGAILRE